MFSLPSMFDTGGKCTLAYDQFDGPSAIVGARATIGGSFTDAHATQGDSI